jgi:acyl-CoA hydrolase
MTHTKKTSADSMIETHQLVLPSHTNALGTIFGGTIMSWIDIAAAICAQKHSGKICVTASVDALNFLNPVRLGHMVKLSARLVYTGRTSMMVSVYVTAQDLKNSQTLPCVDALLTFVALDDQGKPTLVPTLSAESPEEKAAHQKAAERRAALLQLSRGR